MKITGQKIAWASEYSIRDFIEPRRRDDVAEMLDNVVLISPETDMRDDGYTKIGIANVDLEIVDEDTMRANAIESLQAEKQKVLAEAQQKATRLEEKIQNLLAITHNPTDSKNESNIPF